MPCKQFADSVGFYGDIEQEFTLDERKDLDAEGRAVITQHDVKVGQMKKSLIVINVYCPRAGSEKLEEQRETFKMKFNKLLELRANALTAAGFFVIVLGDLNKSHKRIDHCDPSETFEDNP